ncbi:MAG: hypothetical protein CR986_08300 [Ignavibacteriae bacterium]|nr:MAG: hypothetical protein CR986_08300 [Ignavibacteriota bacterium]
MEHEEINKKKEEVKQYFSSLFETVDGLISGLKQRSSEEILNGSVEKAQKLLTQIIPYQKFYEKLGETRDVFNKIENSSETENSAQTESVSKEDIKLAKEKIKTMDQKEIDEEVKASNKESGAKTENNYRIPVLKALIFLGGSSEEVEVIEFVKKDMKNKLSKNDLEIPEGEQKERWITNLYSETATMIDEGLLIKNDANKDWEIAQKGIDYLSKYSK